MTNRTPDFFSEAAETAPNFFEEEPTQPAAAPQKKSIWDSFGQALAYQAQALPPAETLPQLGAGALEELSLGGINVLPPETEAGQFARKTGEYGIGFPIEMEGLTWALKPFKWLERIIATGVAGGAREAAKEYFRGEDLSPKQILLPKTTKNMWISTQYLEA